MSQATSGQVTAQWPHPAALPPAALPPAAPILHGVAMGTPIQTLDGLLPVEYLSPGDRIITRRGARRLAAIAVTVLHNARLYTLIFAQAEVIHANGAALACPALTAT